MEHLVEDKIGSLRSMNLAAIRSLSDSSEEVQVDGRPASLHVYHEHDLDGGHRIIVQGIRQSLTRITALVIPRGFLLNGADKIRPLRDHELFAYT